MHAVLLVAHGSRRPEANADLERLAELVRERQCETIDVVEIGFLELTGPSIPDGFAKCVEAGATSVRIVPYFLSMGVHMQEDLTEIREQFAKDYPQVAVSVERPLGLHPKVVDVVLERCGVGQGQVTTSEGVAVANV